jgi:hypothetical protein
VAAENIEVWFVGRQPNRLREILERGLCAVRFTEMYLAAVLPCLPETGVQPKRFIQEREPAARRARRRQMESLSSIAAESGVCGWRSRPTK